MSFDEPDTVDEFITKLKVNLPRAKQELGAFMDTRGHIEALCSELATEVDNALTAINAESTEEGKFDWAMLYQTRVTNVHSRLARHYTHGWESGRSLYKAVNAMLTCCRGASTLCTTNLEFAQGLSQRIVDAITSTRNAADHLADNTLQSLTTQSKLLAMTAHNIFTAFSRISIKGFGTSEQIMQGLQKYKRAVDALDVTVEGMSIGTYASQIGSTLAAATASVESLR